MAKQGDDGQVFIPTEPRNTKVIKSWWMDDTPELARLLFDTAEILRNEQTYMERRNRVAIELYENVEVEDLDSWRFATEARHDGPYQFNQIEAIIDTVHAEIITNRTKVQFLTSGGDWEDQERAEELTKFAAGLFYETDVHEKIAPRMAKDALVFGTGVVHRFTNQRNRVGLENVFPHEILIDDIEAANSGPRQLLRERLVSRDVLAGIFKDDKEKLDAILAAPEHEFRNTPHRPVTDIVKVITAHHLPSFPGADDGRMVQAINVPGGVLVDEPWTEDDFPYVFLRYKERTKGFWGKGIPEILEGSQELINDMREKKHAQLMGASPYEWIRPGNRITEAESSNRIWRQIESDEPPQMVVPPAVSPDLQAAFREEQNDASGLIGVNRLMMQSELPPGIDGGSGRAVRIFNDTKSKRYMEFARAYENAHVVIAEQMVEQVTSIVDAGEAYEVSSPNTEAFDRLDFSEIRLPENAFVIRPFPIAFLSDTPSGRLSDIEALAGIFPEQMKPYLLRLLQAPDLEMVTDLLSSDTDVIRETCSLILRGKKKAGDIPPEPFYNLALSVQIARQCYVSARSKGAPEERLAELINWIKMVEVLQKQLQPPVPAPAAVPAGAMGAGGPVGALPPEAGPSPAGPAPVPGALQ